VEGAVRRTDVHRHYRHPQSVLRRSQLHLLVYDVGTEELTQWHP